MRSFIPLFTLVFLASAPVLAAEVVSVPPFRSIELRGGGEVVVVPGPAQRVAIVDGSSQFTRVQVQPGGKLRIDACSNARCPQHYRLRVEIQSPRVPDLAVSGGGQITTGAGFAAQQQLAAAVHGGGRIDARTLQASSVTAAVSGGGEVVVHPRSSLTAAVNGGGMVRFLGHPQVTSVVHGGGLVRSAD